VVTGISRRRYLGNAVAAVGGILAAGCGAQQLAPAEKVAPTGPRQALEIWRPGAKEDKPWGVTIDGVLMDFAASQSRWDVNIVYPGDGYEQKLTTQVVAGNPPAAFRGWVRSIQSMAPTSQLTALDAFVKNEKGFNLPDFWPAATAMSTYQGHLFGIPKTVQPQVLFYSRRRMREAGIDASKLPDTLEDWVLLGDKLFEKSGDAYAKVGFVPWIPGVNAPAFLPEFGADWFDAKNMKVTANTPECIACFEWHKSVADRYSPAAVDPFVAANNAAGWGRYSKTGAMHTGLVAIFQHAGWWLGSALEWMQPDLDLAYRPVPRAKNAKNPKASQMTGNEWMIPAGAPLQEGGWAVLKWMATEPVMLKLAIMDTLLPGRKSVTNAPEYAKQPFSKVWIEVAGNARPEDVHVSAALMTQRLNAALNDVLRGKQNAKDALDAVTREVQADLDSKRR
jgi:ABC-type glycerol-3-phosphate transport system substrate-binding protein